MTPLEALERAAESWLDAKASERSLERATRELDEAMRAYRRHERRERRRSVPGDQLSTEPREVILCDDCAGTGCLGLGACKRCGGTGTLTVAA